MMILSALSKTFQSTKKLGILLTLIVFLVYSPSLFNGFVGDDFLTIQENIFIHSPQNFPLVFTRAYLTSPQDLHRIGHSLAGSGEKSYRPVVTISYFFDYIFWKLNPFGYHLTNVLVHAANALLLFQLGLLLTKERMIAFLSALFFAIHPVQAEAVLIPSFREDLLVCFFGFLLFLTHILGNQPFCRRKEMTRFCSALFLFLAMFSKESGLLWILVLCLYDVFVCFDWKWMAWVKASWERYKYMIPVLLFYFWVIFGPMKSVLIPDTHGIGQSWGGHVLLVMKVVGSYFSWIVWPVHVPAMLPFSPAPVTDRIALFSVAVFLCLVVLLLGLKVSRTVKFAASAFVLLLLPVSQVIPLESLMAARYLYFPMMAASVIFGWAVWSLARFCWTAVHKQGLLLAMLPGAIFVLCVGLFVFYAGLITQKIYFWKDEIGYRMSMVEDHPDSPMAYRFLSGAYERNNSYDKALQALRKAKELTPRDWLYYVDSALIYKKMGNAAAARAELLRAAELCPDSPLIPKLLQE